MESVKILVSGDRHWTDKDYIFQKLDEISILTPPTIIIEGCAPGVDSIAEEWAKERGIENEHFPADWDRYGRAAGPIRNQEMLTTEPDLLVAFHPDLAQSKGTRNMVGLAEKAGVLTYVFTGR